MGNARDGPLRAAWDDGPPLAGAWVVRPAHNRETTDLGARRGRAPSLAVILHRPREFACSVPVRNADPTAAVLLLTTLVLVGLAMLLVAFAWAVRSRRTARGIVATLVVLLCAHAVLAARADWEWRLFPWPAYAYLQGFTLYALAATFFGAAAATLPVRWNRVVVVCVGLGVLGHGVQRHAWLAWPETHGDERMAGADHHVCQSSHYTCGPAACVAALSHCGLRISERELAAVCLTRREGSRLFDLYRGLVLTLADRPFDVSIEDLTADELVAQDQIVVGSNSGRGHALCIAIANGQIVVHDPLAPAAQRGSVQRLRDEFRSPAIVIRARAATTPRAAPLGH